MNESDLASPSLTERHQPETLRLRGISPTLTVSDLAASLVWYRDHVGFVVDETWEHEGELRGVSLLAGTSTLMLVQDDWAKGRDRVKGVGLRLYLTTIQNIDDVAQSIVSRGGHLASGPTDTAWGTRIVELVDPDGYKLTIASERATS